MHTTEFDKSWGDLQKAQSKSILLPLVTVASLICVVSGMIGLALAYEPTVPPIIRCDTEPSRRLISEIIYKDGSVECRYDRFAKK